MTAETDPDPNHERIRLECVVRVFHEGGRASRVLDGVDLRLHAGEVVALLGRSGSGKSTLLNLIAGIDRPDAGAIRVAGERIDRLGEPHLTRLRRARMGFVYQFFNLLPTLTVAENVALPLELNGAGASGPRVAEVLRRVGLSGLGDRFPDRLSGGEQQRVAIARAIVHRPPIVLADEPTGNLDAESGREILALLTGLARDGGATLLIVTHSEEVAARADRVVQLVDGRLRDAGAGAGW